MRASHSTKSKIVGSIKDKGEKVEILESFNPNKNLYLIQEDIDMVTDSGLSYTLQKGKSIEVLSKGNRGVKIQFKDKDLKVLTTVIDEKYVEKITSSVWYKIRRDNDEVGWVYGKFIGVK